MGRNNPASMVTLLRYGADPRPKNCNELSLLQYAVQMHFSKLLQAMLEHMELPSKLPFEESGGFAFNGCINPLCRMIHAGKHYKGSFFDTPEVIKQMAELDQKDLLCQAFDDDNVDTTRQKSE